MAHLAQAYIHFRPYLASDTKIRSLGEYAERIASEAATEIYGGGVQVQIEIEEGSLRTRLTVIGALTLGVYSGIADYKGFKESLVSMCEDARDFAVDVCAPFTERAGVPQGDIFRFERRLKTPGKLYRMAKAIEKLEGSADRLSRGDIRKELARLRGELQLVAEDLTRSELQAVAKRLHTKKLPPPSRWPTAGVPKSAIHKSESEEELPLDDLKKARGFPPPRRVVFSTTIQVPVKEKRTKRPPRADRTDFLSDEYS